MEIRQRLMWLFAGLLATAVLGGCTKGESDTENDAAQEKEDTKSGEPAELFVSTLHDLDMPEPGAMWIEVDDERIELAVTSCKYVDLDRGERWEAFANVDDETHGPTQITIKREVGDGTRFPFEYELLQLTLVGGTETREMNGISMMQHSHYKKDGFKWLRGGGEVPVLRIVGDQMTAKGTLEAAPFAERPLKGDFALALSCPEED